MTAEDDEILKMKEKLAEMEREASSLREEQGIDGKADEQWQNIIIPTQRCRTQKTAKNAGRVGEGKPSDKRLTLGRCSSAKWITARNRGCWRNTLRSAGREPGDYFNYKFENPKGFAYVEFSEKDAVDAAVLLDGTKLEEFRSGSWSGAQRERTGRDEGYGRGREEGEDDFGFPAE